MWQRRPKAEIPGRRAGARNAAAARTGPGVSDANGFWMETTSMSAAPDLELVQSILSKLWTDTRWLRRMWEIPLAFRSSSWAWEKEVGNDHPGASDLSPENEYGLIWRVQNVG